MVILTFSIFKVSKLCYILRGNPHKYGAGYARMTAAHKTTNKIYAIKRVGQHALESILYQHSINKAWVISQ